MKDWLISRSFLLLGAWRDVGKTALDFFLLNSLPNFVPVIEIAAIHFDSGNKIYRDDIHQFY